MEYGTKEYWEDQYEKVFGHKYVPERSVTENVPPGPVEIILYFMMCVVVVIIGYSILFA